MRILAKIKKQELETGTSQNSHDNDTEDNTADINITDN